MRRRGWFAVALGIAALSLALFAAGCGDDGEDDGNGAPSPTTAQTQVQADDDAAEVEAFLRALYDDYNNKDVDAVLASVTDKLLQDELGVPREEAAEVFAEFIGEPPQVITEISNIEVTDDTATAEVAYTTGKVAVLERDFLVREEGVWKLDAFEQIPQEVPEGVTAVDVTTTEYRFTFDESAITSGNLAFNVSNIGGEQHVVDISKIPEDLDIEQALQSEQEPAGVEEIGGIEPLDPGSDTTLIFTEPLEPGRYVMVCFVEAADGEPHALKGMWAEFTIE